MSDASMSAEDVAHLFGQSSAWHLMDVAPHDGRDVLINNADGITIGWWDSSSRSWCYQNEYLSIDCPTHWMPLPAPPYQEWD
jgi:hypothetical protein